MKGVSLSAQVFFQSKSLLGVSTCRAGHRTCSSLPSTDNVFQDRHIDHRLSISSEPEILGTSKFKEALDDAMAEGGALQRLGVKIEL